MNSKTYKITISDSATYYVKTNNLDHAIEQALEWFDERKPDIYTEETDEEPETEIN